MARNPALGCILSPLLQLVFYGALAVISITLVFYPAIYIQDARSADAYRTAPACPLGMQSNDCRATVQTEVSNMGTFDGKPKFDLQINGVAVTVNAARGSYEPRNGDAVEAEVWRGQPVRIVGPNGDVMITIQYPDDRVQTDRDVLGPFLFIGIAALISAVLVGWFGRALVFARFQNLSRSNRRTGILLTVGLLIVIVPVIIIGDLAGWLPKGRAGGAVVALGALAVVAIGAIAVFVYRRLRGAR